MCRGGAAGKGGAAYLLSLSASSPAAEERVAFIHRRYQSGKGGQSANKFQKIPIPQICRRNFLNFCRICGGAANLAICGDAANWAICGFADYIFFAKQICNLRIQLIFGDLNLSQTRNYIKPFANPQLHNFYPYKYKHKMLSFNFKDDIMDELHGISQSQIFLCR